MCYIYRQLHITYHMKDILYSYALDPSGRPVHISDITRDIRSTFTCIQCGTPMLPKLGDIRRHHFSHASACSCSQESYLHRLAKTLLREKFNEMDSFPIEMVRLARCSHFQDCEFYIEDICVKKEFESFDLKRYYDTCREECAVNGYVADLLLSDSTGRISEPLLIEVRVTHQCSGEKRDSGLRIIEIPVGSESDVMYYATNPLREGEVSLFGFIRQSAECLELSSRHMLRFILFESGRIFCDEPSCIYRHRKMKPGSLLELNIDASSIPNGITPQQVGIVKAIDLGMDIRSCLICRHANRRKGILDCRMSLIRDTPAHPAQTFARTCPCYAADATLLEGIRKLSGSVPVSQAE